MRVVREISIKAVTATPSRFLDPRLTSGGKRQSRQKHQEAKSPHRFCAGSWFFIPTRVGFSCFELRLPPYGSGSPQPVQEAINFLIEFLSLGRKLLCGRQDLACRVARFLHGHLDNRNVVCNVLGPNSSLLSIARDFLGRGILLLNGRCDR